MCIIGSACFSGPKPWKERGNCKNVPGGWEVKKMEYAALTTSITGICESLKVT